MKIAALFLTALFGISSFASTEGSLAGSPECLDASETLCLILPNDDVSKMAKPALTISMTLTEKTESSSLGSAQMGSFEEDLKVLEKIRTANETYLYFIKR